MKFSRAQAAVAKRLGFLIVVLAALVAPLSWPAAGTGASLATAKAPACASVSPALIRRFLGGTPTKPKRQASQNVVICHYTTVDVIFVLHQNKALFQADQKSNKGRAITGLGTAAFSYRAKGSSVVSVEVLDHDVAFIVSGSSAGLAKTERLAKAIVPLV